MGKSFDFSEFDAIDSIKYRSFDNSVKEIRPFNALSFNSAKIPYETQAITYYMVGQIMEQANLSLENVKLKQRQLAGALYNLYVKDKKLVELNNNKKPTDAMINAAIDANQSYVKLSKVVNDRQAKYNVLKDLFKAFEQRKDLMQSLSAQKRVEMNMGGNSAINQPNK